MGSSHFRASHALKKHTKRSAGCSTGNFYITPTNGQSIPTAHPLNITWDTSCINTTAADIYLYAPGTNQPRIHIWEGVDFTSGSYSTTLKPKWWNATSTVSLQLAIVQAGTPPFLSILPAGPVFTAVYTPGAPGQVAADADTSTPDPGITQVNALTASHGLSPGKKAAATLFPLLIVLGLLIAAYLKMTRARAAEKRQRFSIAVDKRMSTISTDWKSITPAGAQAAIASSANRASAAFSFGAIRPASTADGAEFDQSATRQMSQLRPGVSRVSFAENRTSRVSFADNRNSRVSRVSFADNRSSRAAVGTSRAFHSSFVPPVPILQHDTLSPTQTQGALDLTPEDIHAGAVMPALTMMRTGTEGLSPTDDNDFLLPPYSGPPTPTPLSPTHPKSPQSPVGMMPMQPVPASVMSPDDMLRAYAARRATNGSGSGGISYPMPVAVSGGSGMRALYSPPAVDNEESSNRVTVASVYSAQEAQQAEEEDEEAGYVGHAA